LKDKKYGWWKGRGDENTKSVWRRGRIYEGEEKMRGLRRGRMDENKEEWMEAKKNG
jgi:hypothetical protein